MNWSHLSCPPEDFKPPPPILGAGANLVEPHVARVPRVIVDRTALQAAALAFAAGEIDRAELNAEDQPEIAVDSI